MKVVAVEEQTFQLVCRRFSTFASQVKSICMETAKDVLNAPREMLVSRADLEEETVDEVLRILGEEFEEE